MDLEMIQNFSQILNNHVARHRALAASIALEKRFPAGQEAPHLPFEVLSKEEIAMEIQDSVHLLISAIKDVAIMLGMTPHRQPLLADVAARLPEPFKAAVKEDISDLERLKNIIHTENEMGSHYIEEAMRLVCGNLNVLSGFARYISQGYPEYE